MQLGTLALALVLFFAACVDLQTHVGDLSLQALQPLTHRFERELDLSALKSQCLELLPRHIRFTLKPLRLLFKAGECCCRLRLFVARLRGALNQLERLTSILFSLLFGHLECAYGLLGLLLLLLGRLA